MDLEQSFRKYAVESNLGNENVLIAVSGGIDSMVMLSLMHSCDIRGAVAHCNFSLRGEESDQDQALVEREAALLGYKCHSIRFRTEEEAAETGESIQMAARRLRYRWFDELCREFDYTRIAIAHNLNDSIETCLINLCRGSGLAGISGIRPAGGTIIRPLLENTRAEIADYAARKHVVFREDSSNSSDHYNRNYIRHNIVPVFKDRFPNFEKTMKANLERFSATEHWLEVSVREYINKTVRSSDSVEYALIRDIKDSPEPSVFLYHWLKQFGFCGKVASKVLKAMDGISGKLFYSPTHTLSLDRGAVRIQPIDSKELSMSIEGLGMEMSQFEKPMDFVQDSDPNVAYLDRDLLSLPLQVRCWKEGDRFRPLGMKNFKKLSDFFIDRKIPLTEKNRIPIVLSGEDIVWIAGERIDDRFKITDKTRNILRIEIL